MISRGLRFGLFLVAVFLHANILANPPQAWGYVGWWLPQSWREAPLEQFDRLLFFQLKVGADGTIADHHGWPQEWQELREAVQASHTPLDLTLTLLEPDAFNALFSSVQATQRLIDEAATLVQPVGVAGLQLDFEIYNLASPQAIGNFRIFLRMLASQLRQMTPPKNLSVFFPVGAEPPLYDAQALGVVDHVVLQGYDVHWRDSKIAGPLAPLGGDDVWTWRKMLARGESLGVSRDKLLLGFPLFGYEWSVKEAHVRGTALGRGSVTSFAPIPPDSRGELQFSVQERVSQHGGLHDPTSGSSYYQFTGGDGQCVEGWFEDRWALSKKIDFLTVEKLGGIAFFMLGYDGGQLVNFFLQQRKANEAQGASVSLPNGDLVSP